MHNFKKLLLSSGVLSLVFTVSANAVSGYANTVSAMNINMLTERMMSYVHRGENISTYFSNKSMYGTMTRFDEYGDDGSTLKGSTITTEVSDSIFKNVWGDVDYVNGHMHFSSGNTFQSKMFIGTIGSETNSIDLKYGDVSFGGFVSYINGEFDGLDSQGNGIGVFGRYNYKNFDTAVMINDGSLNTDFGVNDFSNAWFNVAADMSIKIKIDNTLYLEPRLYAGYTWVSSDNLYISGNFVSENNFNLWNVVPSVRFIKNIADDWYGTLSGKYVAKFNDDNDIHINGVRTDGVTMDNYFEIATGVEYDYHKFVFNGVVTKQIGGIDSWGGNINVKYLF